MKDFKNNAAIVISTLERYRYEPRAISLNLNCYDSLYSFLIDSGSKHYSADAALNWCETNVAKHIQTAYVNAAYRLGDIYESGRALESHLTVYAKPSEQFSEYIEVYLGEITARVPIA